MNPHLFSEAVGGYLVISSSFFLSPLNTPLEQAYRGLGVQSVAGLLMP